MVMLGMGMQFQMMVSRCNSLRLGYTHRAKKGQRSFCWRFQQSTYRVYCANVTCLEYLYGINLWRLRCVWELAAALSIMYLSLRHCKSQCNSFALSRSYCILFVAINSFHQPRHFNWHSLQSREKLLLDFTGRKLRFVKLSLWSPLLIWFMGVAWEEV